MNNLTNAEITQTEIVPISPQQHFKKENNQIYHFPSTSAPPSFYLFTIWVLMASLVRLALP